MLASDKSLKLITGLFVLGLVASETTFAGPRDTAFRIHQRYAGVPPTSAVLDQMEALVIANNLEGAARIAMANPGFSNIILRTFFSTWSNRELNPDVALNDTILTLIGLVRDGRDFRGALYEDIICHVNQNLWFDNFTNNSLPQDPTIRVVRQPRADRNDHFFDAEERGIDLHNPNEVVCSPQSVYTATVFNGTDNGAPVARPYAAQRIEQILASEAAGIQTTRGFGEAFFTAGTNRRGFAFIIQNFFGAGVLGMDGVHDTSLPDFLVRRDVPRDPSGNSLIFRNKCVGCHANMDGNTGAYAYWNFGNSLVHGRRDGTNDPASQVLVVDGKMNRNANVFPGGHEVIDNSWTNLMTQGINAPRFQFRVPASGQNVTNGVGAKSLGEVLANARLFSESLAKRVFNKVCFRNPTANSPEETAFNQMIDNFEATGYDVRNLFATSASFCLANLD